VSFAQLTLPNLLGYCTVLVLLWRAASHAFECIELCRGLRVEAGYFRDLLEKSRAQGPRKLGSRSPVRRKLSQAASEYPAAGVLARVLKFPREAREDLSIAAWVSREVNSHIGSLQRSMEFLKNAAPIVGVMGTVSGLMIGAMTLQTSTDARAFFASVALALVTTLVCAFISLVEKWFLERRLGPLIRDMVLDCHEAAGIGRTMNVLIRRRKAVDRAIEDRPLENHRASKFGLDIPAPHGHDPEGFSR
jgi:biopolymer transport protein ExbB/TolQ